MLFLILHFLHDMHASKQKKNHENVTSKLTSDKEGCMASTSSIHPLSSKEMGRDGTGRDGMMYRITIHQ